MKRLLIGFVRMWRKFVSPTYGPVCKYYPSCSQYALDALETHGALRGAGLAIWRILRCNPFSNGGVDPVPGSELAARIASWDAESASNCECDPGAGHDMAPTWAEVR